MAWQGYVSVSFVTEPLRRGTTTTTKPSPRRETFATGELYDVHMDLMIPSDFEDAGRADARVRHRATYPTAEERAAGIDDPLAQARQVLWESDLRSIDAAPGFIEHRTSEQTVPPL